HIQAALRAALHALAVPGTAGGGALAQCATDQTPDHINQQGQQQNSNQSHARGSPQIACYDEGRPVLAAQGIGSLEPAAAASPRRGGISAGGGVQSPLPLKAKAGSGCEWSWPSATCWLAISREMPRRSLRRPMRRGGCWVRIWWCFPNWRSPATRRRTCC